MWVVDGTRRKKRHRAVWSCLARRHTSRGNPNLRKTFSDSCLLLREWADSPSPIFIDLGQAQILWWVLARGVNGSAYLAPYSRAKFIESHRSGATEMAAREFDKFVSEIPKLVANYESWTGAQRIPGHSTIPDPQEQVSQTPLALDPKDRTIIASTVACAVRSAMHDKA